MKHLTIALSALLFGAVILTPLGTNGAAPDGAEGIWADTVISAPQGTRADGSPVSEDNSNPWDALGAAESVMQPGDWVVAPSSWFSLGFGGKITLKFDQAIPVQAGMDIQVLAIDKVVATSTAPRPQVKVEASQDSFTWVTLVENGVGDVQADLKTLTDISYIQLTDVSDPSLFAADAEGYQVDGVRTLPTKKVSGITKWRGPAKVVSFWQRDKNRDNDFLNGQVFNKRPAKGDFCQTLWNEAIAFNNNYEVNPVYRGVAFQDTIFHSNARTIYRFADGLSIYDIHESMKSFTCDTQTSNPYEIMMLRRILHFINGRTFVWYPTVTN